MDKSQIIVALISSLASVAASVIAGYFAVRVARVEHTQKKDVSNSDANEDVSKANQKNKMHEKQGTGGSLRLNPFSLAVLFIPVVFTLVFLGNQNSGVADELLLVDTLDATIIAPIAFFVANLITSKFITQKVPIRRVFIPSIIIGVLNMPFVYFLGMVVSAMLDIPLITLHFSASGEVERVAFAVGVPLDAMIMGGLAITLGFLLGASVNKITLLWE